MPDDGLLTPPTIDVSHLPPVRNQDGSVSTVRSISVGMDGKEVLIPTVVDGRVVSNEDAIKEFQRTGRHLGMFRDVASANAYAQQLHLSEERRVMPDDLMTVEQFGASVKAKYPDYASVPDAEVGAKMLEKYPEYRDRVKVAPMNTATVNGARVPVDAEDPNTLGTFASHVGAQINPITAAQSVGNAILHPLVTAQAIGAAQGALFDKAKASYEKGDVGTAARHFVDYLLPLVGPVLDKAADASQAGHLAAGAGDAVGLGLAMFGPKALASAGQAVQGSKLATAAADTADAMGNRRVVDVIKPTVGANKVRFGNMAADVAPDVARSTTGLTRSAVAESIGAKLEDATAALDTAADNRLNARTFPTRPVLDALRAAKDKLTASAVEGSEFTPQSGVNRPALGEDVVPGPNAPRVQQITQAIKEVEALGPVARYEALRRIRAAYDGPAKAIYSPSMTQDFMAKVGEKQGAADVTGALRNYLARLDPETARANADYSLWKKANDVVQAAEETDRARPTVGRTIMARGLGAATGAAAGGPIAAAVGAMVGPLLERGAMSLAPAMKLALARQLASLADALRGGQATRAAAMLQSIRRMMPAGSALSQSVGAAVPSPAGVQAPETAQ